PSVVLFHDETPWYVGFLLIGLQVALHLVEGACDRAGEREDRCNHESRDHCEDDAVLGHRLALLHAEPRAEVSHHVRERHCAVTSSRAFGRARRALKIEGLKVNEVEST